MRGRWFVLGLGLLLLAGALCARADGLEGLHDENEAEEAAAVPEPGVRATPVGRVKQQKKAFSISDFFGPIEGAAGAALCLFCLNYVIGRITNARRAIAWGKVFAAGEDNMLARNFSSVDIPDGTLVQESAHRFKVYATGRRHVTGMLVTLDLRARQDLLALLWYVFSPTEDCVVYEAQMAEASTTPGVLVVGTTRAARRLAADQPDVERYARKLQVSKETLPGWPADKLTVHAEHATMFYDLFGEGKVLSTLSAASPGFKWFRSVHITDEGAEGTHKRVVRFTFALPPPGRIQELDPLVALVPLLIDLVGSYKLPGEARKKAEAARAKAAEEEATDGRKARLEALAARKQEKMEQEKARLARLPPAERQKAEEKLQKRQMDRQLKRRMKY